jgi:ubiquinone/menaquinone biosynthesis C-methylase UbiE
MDPVSGRQQKLRAVELHSEQAEEFQARYEAMAKDPYRSTFTYGRRKIEGLIDAVTGPLPPGTRALDVGCGTGFNLQRLRLRGYDVTGVEPATAMRERAQVANPGVRIADGDIENLPFEDQSFELVLAIEVIRYLADPQHALHELARVLRPGGIAIVTAAPLFSLNGYALINAVTSRVKIPTFTKVKHSFVTERSARRAMHRAGFRQVAVHGRFLGPWQGLLRLAPRALPHVLRTLEPLDDALSDVWLLRDLTNHLILVGRR